MKKNITFTVLTEKEVTRIDKNGDEITKQLSYILQFIDSTRFMTSWLLNLVTNPSRGIYRIKCKFRHGDKNKNGIKYTYCNFFLKYMKFKDDLIECKC